MSSSAMKTLVVVVRQRLPVEVPLHPPGVVVTVIGEIEVTESFLLINPTKLGLPGYRRLLRSVEVVSRLFHMTSRGICKPES
jgi:hypothetical protein